MSLTGCSSSCDSPRDRGPGGRDAGTPVDCTTGTCPDACRLVSLTVASGATQQNVSGARNWAALKQNGQVIVEATTEPNTSACWNQIVWSGDTASAVPGHPNRRQLGHVRQ